VAVAVVALLVDVGASSQWMQDSDVSRRRGRDRLYERSRPSGRAGFRYVGVFPLIGTGGGIGGLGRS
jgi:hypothetical protein